MDLSSPVRGFLDALVHPSAQRDRLSRARHRAFIAPRIAAGFLALATLPVYLLWRGTPDTLEIVVVSWLAAPLASAYFLSRTGRYEHATVISAMALGLLAVMVALPTGGILSPAALWLVLVPLEAALAASRRAVFAGLGVALLGAAALLLVPLLEGSPFAAAEGPKVVPAVVSIVVALLYASWLGSAAAAMARAGLKLLSAEEERYQLLALNMTDVISRHDRHGIALFVSPAAERALGVPTRELTGHGIFDRIHVADRPAYLRALSDAAANGDARSAEFRIKRNVPGPEGRSEAQYIWMEMRCRPLNCDEGASASHLDCEVVGVMREITERKLQEQAIEEARRLAEEADAAKGRFLATMSHELRTPLNAIIGFSAMMLEDGTTIALEPARRLEYARLIHDSGQHLLSVVNLVLDVSKIESGNFVITPEPFAPAEVIRSSCDLLALKAREAGLDLVLHLAPDLPEVVADKRALKQMLLNLLSNAVKFTREGQVTVTASAEGQDLLIVVEDTGVGISEGDLQRVGNPFFQARSSYDRPYDGTGLGLSIVKGLVALHGGAMHIASRLAEGTRVSLRLPLDCEGARSGRHRVVQLRDGVETEAAASGGGRIFTDAAATKQAKKRA